MSKVGNRAVYDRQCFGAIIGRQVQNLVYRVGLVLLVEQNSLFADATAVGNLLAAVPFCGLHSQIV
jgi:hypothetical protein